MERPQVILANRYQLVERIGRGGSGEVWRAIDMAHGFGRVVCIKRLLVGLSEDHGRELADEARLLANFRHANVVSLLDVIDDTRGAPALVLELIEGSNLAKLCAAASRPSGTPGLLPDRVAVHVACGVLRALAALERALPGFVHRDVTPHNVLVSKEGEVKLTDFGIALSCLRERRTKPFLVKGKLGYMAPEQARGESLDARVDVFAAGVMLYELLTGVRPWAPAKGMRELRRIEQGEGRAIDRVRDIDRGLAAILAKMLAHRRVLRFSTADEALRSLAGFGAGDLGSLHLATILRTMEYKIPLHLEARATASFGAE